MNLGKLEEAIETFDKVIEVAPDQTPAYYYKSQSLYKLQKYKEALKVCDELISISPNFSGASDLRHKILQKL